LTFDFEGVNEEVYIILKTVVLITRIILEIHKRGVDRHPIIKPCF